MKKAMVVRWPKKVKRKRGGPRTATTSKQPRPKEDESSPLEFATTPPPPPGARWRVEQNIPGHGWQFHGYAKTEPEKRSQIASVRAFGGQPRAVELVVETARRLTTPLVGDEDGVFIGDSLPPTRTAASRSADKRLSVSKVTPSAACPPERAARVVEVDVSMSDEDRRALQAQTAHWLRHAEDAGCPLALSVSILEQVLQASKKALHSRPRAYQEAMNRAPRR